MAFFDKAQIIKMSEHVFRRGNGIPDKRLMHPRREWAIGLLLFATILIAGSVLSAGSFNRFRNIDTTNGEANVNIPKYNYSLVSNVLEEYEKRMVNYSALVADRTLLDEVSSTTASSTVEAVPIESEFPEKIVYTDNMGIDIEPLVAHCEVVGGVFNECGSVCPETAEVCTDQCAYTCELGD